jgi:hypothetical protein
MEAGAHAVGRSAAALAELETPPPVMGEACAAVLRAAASELAWGRPLPVRLEQALVHLVDALDHVNGKTAGDDLELPQAPR